MASLHQWLVILIYQRERALENWNDEDREWKGCSRRPTGKPPDSDQTVENGVLGDRWGVSVKYDRWEGEGSWCTEYGCDWILFFLSPIYISMYIYIYIFFFFSLSLVLSLACGGLCCAVLYDNNTSTSLLVFTQPTRGCFPHLIIIIIMLSRFTWPLSYTNFFFVFSFSYFSYFSYYCFN